MRKDCSSYREKLLKFKAEGREFAKVFEITRTINSNSESSDQFLKQNAFLTCYWKFLRCIILEQLKLKSLGFRNLQEKLEKVISILAENLNSVLSYLISTVYSGCNEILYYPYLYSF